MVAMNRRRTLIAIVILACLLVAVAVAGIAMGSRLLVVAGIGLAIAPLAVYVLIYRPTWYAAFPGIVLGFMPFAAVPGTGFHMVVMLSAMLFVLALVHPAKTHPRLGSIGITMVIYLALSLVSAIATYTSMQTLVEYAKWAIATASMLAALLMQEQLRTVLFKSFSISAAVGALFTLGMLVVDRAGGWINRFGFLGYGGSVAVNERTAVTSSGEVVRAAGLYIDPNSAGLFFLFAIATAATCTRGLQRALVIGALAVGVLGTLSRAAIASLLVAAIITILFANLTAAQRLVGLAGMGGAFVAVLMVPAVSSRLFDSFGSGDKGTTDRIDALQRYPGHMAGNWWFGRGWNLREFSDPFYGYTLNHAANTPLIVIYRAGLLAGIAFLVLMIITIVVASRLAYRRYPGAALQLGVVVGLTFIAFQLDFPVVTMPPLAMAFALMLGSVQAGALDPKYREMST